ncbi:SatD family protein [Microbacterium sp.]|uniref:SatD family protein n=1 Tax=Microbacterium sp. TaxID=51671 RepID=UPI003A847677
MVIAVTSDIVGSRRLDDRAGAQRLIDEAIARAEADAPSAIRPLRPTVGDEQQGVYPRLESALCATLLISLALPDGIQLRFGIGIGDIGSVPAAAGAISEGPGWWAARAAIERVHALAQRAVPEARTWVEAAAGEDASSLPTVNAYALARDRIVADMSERTRRLTYGRCLERTQRDLAATEGITQSAVSQALAAAGAAAIVTGFSAMRG